jgi:putative membrane-bound dehydrogenase-like protein
MSWILLLLAAQEVTPAEDLSVRLFAKEPQVYNPICIDVDERGRVWVAEGVNYRRQAGPKSATPPYFRTPLRKTGDRIVILEDTTGSGVCDKSTVFYEGLDIQAPMGIAVFGGKVWISQAPDLVTIEINPDGTAGKKETLLTGFAGLNGDHSLHSCYLGPDGRIYLCIGDNGGNVLFPDGKRLVTDGKPWIGGVIARTRPDLSGLEVLAFNHRNQVECCTDSFGTTFTSDNDQDGTQWVRFHGIVEGADYGWYGPKGSHWRMEQPGVMPTVMRTGAGAPAGICMYEGTLLPERYRGIPIQADAVGRIHGFPVAIDGAGWRVAGAPVDAHGRQTIDTLSQIRMPLVLLSSKDPSFRPTDVAVAPDGSLFVSDWYDPVIGGGGMEDPWSGRIYRLVPKGHDGSYRVPPTRGPAEQLASPCLATRARAVLSSDPEAFRALLASPDRRLRARALWRLGPEAARPVLNDPDPEFRALAIRIFRQSRQSFGGDIFDPSPLVRRELLLTFRSPEIVAELASQYDGYDRWYLESVAIASRGREEAVAHALLKRFPAWDRRIANLLWVLGRPEAIPGAVSAAMNDGRDLASRVDAIEVLGGFHQVEAGEAVIHILGRVAARDLQIAAMEALARNVSLSWRALAERPDLRTTLDRLESQPGLRDPVMRLRTALGTRALVRWKLSPSASDPECQVFLGAPPSEVLDRPELLPDWKDSKATLGGQVDLRPQLSPNRNATAWAVTVLSVREACDPRLLLGSTDGVAAWLDGRKIWGKHVHRELTPREDVIPLHLDEGIHRLLVRSEIRGGNWGFLAEVEDPGRRVTEVTPRGASRPPAPGDRLDPKELPPIPKLLSIEGDAARGRDVFFRTDSQCSKCHKVKGEGGDLGPELSVIGAKFGREGLLVSILRPSDAIAPEYHQWIVRTKSGALATGIIAQETKDSLVLKDPEGKLTTIPIAEVEERKKSDVSPMPDNLVGALSRQDLADLLEFLTTLR